MSSIDKDVLQRITDMAEAWLSETPMSEQKYEQIYQETIGYARRVIRDANH